MLGALLHDLGKGYPGDHTEVGMDLVRAVGPKLGLVPADVEILVTMVEQHLLLPDVAMRRDLTDPATIEQVATAVGTVEVLDLLHALTEADSLATGPSAWGDWKEGLVERARRPSSSRARWRRCRRGDLAAVPRRRDARRDGGGRAATSRAPAT